MMGNLSAKPFGHSSTSGQMLDDFTFGNHQYTNQNNEYNKIIIYIGIYTLYGNNQFESPDKFPVQLSPDGRNGYSYTSVMLVH